MKSACTGWFVLFHHLLIVVTAATVACADPDKVTLLEVEITPPNSQLPLGITQQLTATGVYSDSTSADLTSQVTWASSSAANVTVSTSGIASAVAIGTAAITATLGSVTGSVTVTATAAVLQSLAVTPGNASIAVGRTQVYTATGTFSDTTTHDLTEQVTWGTTANGVVSISNTAGSRGLATGLAFGTTSVTATRDGKTATTPVTVTTP